MSITQTQADTAIAAARRAAEAIGVPMNIAVYDDGRHVYVEFPAGIVQGEMPPLFVIGPEGEAQIVNSRIYQHILIVDIDQARLEDAAEHGYIGILGDASREETLRQTMLQQAKALLVCTDRDDTNVLITLTARNLSPDVRIVARVEEAENDKLVRQSGANSTVLPSRVGGILMADSIESSHLATYVMDLISAGGQVTLVEREPLPEEIGQRPMATQSLIVRIVRDQKHHSFWESDLRVQAGDRLIVIRPPQGS